MTGVPSVQSRSHLFDHAQERKLCTHCLATTSGGSYQHIVIQIVQHIEGLRLDGVEASEALVQLLKLHIPA